MFDYKMVSKAVLYVHWILCAYFVIFSNALGVPYYLMIFAGASAVIGGILTLFNNEKLQTITKFSVPVMLITLVTLYGYEAKKFNIIAILILSISCISSLYADIMKVSISGL